MTTGEFQKKLADYKQLIDDDIARYCEHIATQTQDTYGENSTLVAAAYADLLQRGGKRIRGVLTLVGYEMCGGTDQTTILQAARAIEMMHAYMLIIDDIQDRADVRRGGPSVHRLLEQQAAQQGWNDAEHIGTALALNAALLGSHGAGIILANMPADEGLRIKALSIMNNTIAVTAHGQSNDIIAEVSDTISLEGIDKIMQWKTAHYTVLNPLHMGMVFADAGCEDTNAITPYALNLGKAFQITDDLLLLSDNYDKNCQDDIREGKRTLLTVYALQNSAKADVLRTYLGKQDLTLEEFKQCQQIIQDSGAAEYAHQAAGRYVKTALESLHEHADRWNNDSVEFLEGLANYILTRQS